MEHLTYYKEGTKTIIHVSWRYEDKDGEALNANPNVDCFSDITYDTIPAPAKKIVVFHKRILIPYTNEIIQKWIDNLAKFGFPIDVRFRTVTDTVEFTLVLKRYKYKMQLNSALQLIRCLFERFVCYVPEYYFGYLDKNPKATLEQKFAFLQLAHKDTSEKHNYANTNHMVTNNENFITPLKRKTLLERFEKKSQRVYDVYKGGQGWAASAEGNLTKLWAN